MQSNKIVKSFENFGIVVGFCFPLIIGFLIPLLFGHDFRIWTIFIGTLIILGIIYPKSLNKLYEMWFSLGFILGWINSRIILTLVYLSVLIPISMLMRILGYDPLRINFKPNKNSYREIRKLNMVYSLKEYFKNWNLY